METAPKPKKPKAKKSGSVRRTGDEQRQACVFGGRSSADTRASSIDDDDL